MQRVCVFCGQDLPHDAPAHDCVEALRGRAQGLEAAMADLRAERDSARAALARVARHVWARKEVEAAEPALLREVIHTLERAEEERRRIHELEEESRRLRDERTDYFISLLLIRDDTGGQVPRLRRIAAAALGKWRPAPDASRPMPDPIVA